VGTRLHNDKGVRESYIRELRQEAHGIGSHGLTAEEFKRSGLFEAAIESIRGTRSATMQEKRAFIDAALSYLRDTRFISEWQDRTAQGRFDCRLRLPDPG
jgi:hypothetical protein